MAIIKRQEFDSEIFKKPSYRVTDFSDLAIVREEFHSLFNSLDSLFIDAKFPAWRRDIDQELQRLGFSKVCMQVTLEINVSGLPLFSVREDAQISCCVGFPEDIAYSHGAGFLHDRFSLDARIDPAHKTELFKRWILNTDRCDSVWFSHVGYDFCSFKILKEISTLKIDLLSVLNPGKGIGTSVLKNLINYAVLNKFSRVIVETQCENAPALSAYRKSGFLPFEYNSCFHFHK